MNKNIRLLSRNLVLIVSFLTFFVATIVQAEPAYEEVTYDDLVNQISKKRKQLSPNSSPQLDELKIYAGVGLITGVNSVRVLGSESYKYQNGFQISLGIDLFSPFFASEAVLRNFGQSHSGSETRSFREFDLKFLYHNRIDSQVGFRAGAGLGTRYFKLSDPVSGADINDSTPTSVLFSGIDVFASSALTLGFEAGFRSAMITSTADKNAVDFTFRIDTQF